MDEERATVAREKQEVEAKKALVRQQEADYWLETCRVEVEKANLESDRAIVLRDEKSNRERELKLYDLENQRLLNRFVSSEIF